MEFIGMFLGIVSAIVFVVLLAIGCGILVIPNPVGWTAFLGCILLLSFPLSIVFTA